MLRKIIKYKTSKVIQKFWEVYEIDFDQTYASIIKSNFYKVFLVLAIQIEWPVSHMDFVIAFFYFTTNRHDIFVKHPLAYKVGMNLIYKLLKAFYELKQSPQIWY